jgi:D-alanyl-D-alanine dipeptidase
MTDRVQQNEFLVPEVRNLSSVSGTGSLVPRAQGAMKWLIDCNALKIPSQSGLTALRSPEPAPPAGPIRENGEPLVALAGVLKTHPVYSWLGFEHSSGTMRLRAGVLERLERASRRLPDDFEIVVIDAHRTRAFQAELLTYYLQVADTPLVGFVSDPWSNTPVPPHTTGGAVDLTLGWRGAALGLGTDFDAFLPDSALTALEDSVGSPARELRRLLASFLQAEGMSAIGSEWWHWSYGDQHWAARTGAQYAFYDEIALP